jgi:hypothetical protein
MSRKPGIVSIVRPALILSILLIAGVLPAQNGQQGSRPNWPCVPGRAVDPNYLDLSESTGGQLVLFQKGEAGHAGPVMSASYTHPATVMRVVGQLSGTRDFEFPVDSTIESLLLLVSVQCRNRALVFRPSGVEVTQRTAALAVELTSASILRVDQPEPGKWKLRLSGTGLFVASVLAKTRIAVTDVKLSADDSSPPSLELRVSGQPSRLALQLVDATGLRIAELASPETDGQGAYRTAAALPAQRYRVVVTGEDDGAWPFQRTHPVLFRPPPAK